MSNVIVGIMIGGAVIVLWGLLYLYGRRCARARRRREACWEEFAARHGCLDAELDRTWNHLRR